MSAVAWPIGQPYLRTGSPRAMALSATLWPAAISAVAGPRRRPTINDIARLAGVSKKTVSRVINASPYVQKDTRERIEAAIAEHGYAPDPQARGLAFRRSFLIGLVYDNPNPQYVVNMQL